MSTNSDSIDVDQTNDNICRPKVFRSLFNPEECQKIINMSGSADLKEGGLGGGTDAHFIDPTVRSSRRGFLNKRPDTAWIYEKISDAVAYMNQFYQFHIDEVEGVQLAQYPVGGHYRWHSDIGSGAPSRRKLSLSIQLSDPSSYTGGELEFSTIKLDNNEDLRRQGAAIIFPSYLTHRVAVVTKGVRWSLVAWILGQPFR